MERRRIATIKKVEEVLEKIEDHLYLKIAKHGDGAFVSNHEAFGAITEEYYELLEELRKNDREGFRTESLDLIVAVLWGILSNEGFDQGSEPDSSRSVAFLPEI